MNQSEKTIETFEEQMMVGSVTPPHPQIKVIQVQQPDQDESANDIREHRELQRESRLSHVVNQVSHSLDLTTTTANQKPLQQTMPKRPQKLQALRHPIREESSRLSSGLHHQPQSIGAAQPQSFSVNPPSAINRQHARNGS